MPETTENNGTSTSAPVVTSMSSSKQPDANNLQDQLRAVTRERSKLRDRLAELEPLQGELTALRQQLADSTNTHSQEMHLMNMGIKSDRARKAIRREYSDEGEDRPAFDEFVGGLRNDEFYGRLFSDTPAHTEAAPVASPAPTAAPVAPTRAMTTNPNAGAEQPKEPTRPLDTKSYSQVKSLAERLEIARRHGLIK